MSHNQSRGDAQPRRPGRPGVAPQQRGFPGGGGAGRGGGGGGGFAPLVPASAPSNAAANANRSFRKPDDGQASQPRVQTAAIAQVGVTAASPSSHAVANGPQSQPPLLASLDSSVSSAHPKQVDVSTPNPVRAVPRPPPSQSSSGPPDAGPPATARKGEGAKPFTLQFGSIAPGFVNGMQIPARTSSAPPNLDEQKKDQASRGMFGAPASTISVSSAAKQQPQTVARKDVIDPIQSNSGNLYPTPESKKEIPIQIPAPVSMPSQKSSGLAVPGMSVPMFPQPTQMPLQSGGPNIPMQSQHVAVGSMQMPIAPMQMGNSPQMFVPSLQPHVLHQGQVGFAQSMPHRMPPPLSNVGMGISAQYSQQQAGQFGVSRKTSVKITHPVTHEELRLDKKPDSYIDPSGQRSNLPAQAQPPAFPTPQINFYQNSQPAYAASLFYPPLPLNNAQPTVSQNPRYNFPVVQSGTTVSIVNPSTLASVSVGKPAYIIHKDSEQSHIGHSQGVKTLPVTISAPVQVKPALTVAVDKGEAPSSESASHVNRDVGTKTRKTLLESSQRTGGKVEAVSQNSFEDLPKAVPAPVAVPALLDHHRQAVTSTAYPQQKTESFANVSAPASDLVIDHRSVPAHTHNEKKELHITDSCKDSKKKPSTHEESNSQGEQEADGLASNSSSVLFVESHKDISLSSDKHILENSECTDLHFKPKEVLASAHHTCPVAEHDVPETVIKSKNDILSPDSSDMAEEKGVLGDMHEKDLTSSPITNGHVCSSEHTPDNLGLVPCHEGVQLGAKEEQDAVEATGHSESGVFNDDLSGYSPVEEDSISSCGKSSICEFVLEEVADRDISKQTVTPENSNNIDREVVICVLDTNGASTEVVEANVGNVSFVNSEVDTFSSTLVVEDKLPVLEHPMLETGGLQGLDVGAVKSSKPSQLSVLGSDNSDTSQKVEEKTFETAGVASRSSSMAKDGPDVNRTKAAPGKRKKRRDILSRADAAGTNSDLYMAYKGSEEHQTVAVSTEDMDGAFVVDENKSQVDENTTKEDSQSKTDIDDWEDAVEISSPRLETSGKSGRRIMAKKLGHELGDAISSKRKYTRDFLLTFSDQFIELPFGFDAGADSAALLGAPLGTSHLANNDLLPGRARIIDRPNPTSRNDRRSMGYMDDDKWSKPTSTFPSRDAGSGAGFRAGQGGGVLRIPSRGQGGILTGQMQSGVAQGVARNNVDADRWQRTSGMQKGLIPSPQTPAPVMHKAEKRYEVGQVSDEEEAKQRQIKAILNKLTPQNFDRLFQQVKEVNIDNTNTLTGVISQIFDKALMEPTFCEMYANFCLHLAGALPDFNEDNEKITFKRLLLNKCQEEFERGEREQAEADKADEEGEVKLSEEAKEQKRILARRRMLGNIRLIGELYKKKMLTERIMHECIKKLLGQNQNPDEEDIEALCKLMSTIGEIIDHAKAKEHMDAYFVIMKNLSNNQKLSSRVRFMLKDSIDLRRSNWQQRRKVDGPKTIEEVHRDAAQERAQAGRSSRGSGMGSSSRRGQPPPDYGPHGTATASNVQQAANIRNVASQARGYGSQDVRMEDKHIYESRTLSVPLSQRPIGDDSITLGPQGGLAKGMSLRGQPIMPNPPISDHPGSTGDTRRIVLGPNGHTSISDRNAYVGIRDHGKIDRMSDRPSGRNAAEQNLAISAGTSSTSPRSASFSEEQLRDKSISAIREYYSAKDEKEIGLCIKELNSPAFYPTMVSVWVTDSFERKDIERDLLSNLLVSLCKSGGRVLSQAQLIQGFDLVLAILEDAVNDAPRASEFLGRMLARAILEDVLSFREISRLIHEGGGEPGCLLEAGLSADVLASILEIIKMEKGDAALEELRTSSSLPLESFRPPLPMRSRKLEQFL